MGVGVAMLFAGSSHCLGQAVLAPVPGQLWGTSALGPFCLPLLSHLLCPTRSRSSLMSSLQPFPSFFQPMSMYSFSELLWCFCYVHPSLGLCGKS